MLAKLRDIDLYYEMHGQGKPVVLLHGLTLDGSTWNEVVDLFSDQAQFIVPDLRGHGKTSSGEADGSLEQFADDLFALINHLQLGKITLVGHSLGGYIALAFAEKYQEKLEALIMVTSNALSDSPEKIELRLAEIDKAMQYGMAAVAEPMAQKLTNSVEKVKQIIPIMEKTTVTGFANSEKAISSRKNQLELIKHLEIPLLAIAGSEDQLRKPAVTLEMAEASRFGRAVVLPGVGHLPMLEEPLALGALIVSML